MAVTGEVDLLSGLSVKLNIPDDLEEDPMRRPYTEPFDGILLTASS